jgi:hypothetical protein
MPLNIEPYTCPFTVKIDSQETTPFTFLNLQADADKDYRPLVVPIEWGSLGRHPHSKGDYSIVGMEDLIGVERKSMSDCWSTVLGWETSYEKEKELCGRRERFKKELENLSKLDAAMVVVEASLEACIVNMPAHGVKTVEENRKIFVRSVLSMMIDYHVPWLFCDSRRLAEAMTFRFLERFWRKWQERNKGVPAL